MLVDSTFLIDAERSGDDLDAWIDDDDDVSIAAITVAELRVGALLATGDRRTKRERFLSDIVEVVPVIDYGPDVALAHAELLAQVRIQGRPRDAHDLIIAATAKHSQRTVLSADSSAFGDLDGVETAPHR